MVVNGELQQITEIFLDNIIVTDVKGTNREVTTIETLEPFLPPTGMYFPNEYKSISLRKFASKQWRKSFCWDLYSTGTKHHLVPFLVFRAIKENNANTFNGIGFNKGTVYYLDREIGTRDSDKIYHVIPEFYQELVDLFGEDRVKMTEATKPVKKKTSPKKANVPPPSDSLDEMLTIGTISPGTITGSHDGTTASFYKSFKVQVFPDYTPMQYVIVDDVADMPHSPEEMYLNYFKKVVNGETF